MWLDQSQPKHCTHPDLSRTHTGPCTLIFRCSRSFTRCVCNVLQNPAAWMGPGAGRAQCGGCRAPQAPHGDTQKRGALPEPSGRGCEQADVGTRLASPALRGSLGPSFSSSCDPRPLGEVTCRGGTLLSSQEFSGAQALAWRAAHRLFKLFKYQIFRLTTLYRRGNSKRINLLQGK